MRLLLSARTLALAVALLGPAVLSPAAPTLAAARPAVTRATAATPAHATAALAPATTPGPRTALPSSTPPAALNLYRTGGFRYQDPSFTACTSTSVMDLLNFMALGGNGGPGFRWHTSLSSTTRNKVLAWERAHDTLAATSAGSDPHGIRNALNHFGWGDGTLAAGNRVYEDMSFGSFAAAVRTAVRQIILTNKGVVVIGWAGRHAQMMTGYYGLVGDPFAKNPDGSWANTFTIGGIYFSDPLRSDHMVNVRISWNSFRQSPNLLLRFRTYRETDSPYDDPYTPGKVVSRLQWYGHYVLVVPVR
jgi:hypothetical protein